MSWFFSLFFNKDLQQRKLGNDAGWIRVHWLNLCPSVLKWQFLYEPACMCVPGMSPLSNFKVWEPMFESLPFVLHPEWYFYGESRWFNSASLCLFPCMFSQGWPPTQWLSHPPYWNLLLSLWFPSTFPEFSSTFSHTCVLLLQDHPDASGEQGRSHYFALSILVDGIFGTQFCTSRTEPGTRSCCYFISLKALLQLLNPCMTLRNSGLFPGCASMHNMPRAPRTSSCCRVCPRCRPRDKAAGPWSLWDPASLGDALLFQYSHPGGYQILHLFTQAVESHPACFQALILLNLNAGDHIYPAELSSSGLELSFWTVEMTLNPAPGLWISATIPSF